MAKNQKPRKNPEDETPEKKDDIIDETGMSDLDLESLLAEDDLVADSENTARAAESGTGTDDALERAREFVIDDGEIDLLADDDIDEISDIEEISAEDLLGVEIQGDEAEPRDAGLAPSEMSMESQAKEPSRSAADDEVLGGGDVLEEEIDLLAVEETETMAVEAQGPASTASDAEFDLLDDDEATAPMAPSAGREATAFAAGIGSGSSDPDAGSKKSKEEKKAGKKLGRLPRKPLKKGKDAQPGAIPKGAPSLRGKKSEKSRKSAPAAEKDDARPAAAAGSRGSVAFVCSECYEEFLIPASYSHEIVSCPECLHVGKRSDEDFLRTVIRHKADERKSQALACGAGALLLVLILALLYVTSPFTLSAGGGKKPDSTILYGLLGASALVGIVFAWLTVRAEKNRWEVYF
ncbi:MAG TPA: hypothetical protein VMT52_14805 [Planctomycetota bacterium]|nr:hypothetical protein [Planctomycetota bacterium]